MIIFEDRELEASVLAGRSCIAVPFEIWVPECGESQITVYSCFEHTANMFETLFARAPFEADALKWLDDKLYATVKEFGYIHAEEDIHHLCEYLADDLSQLHKQGSCADVRIVYCDAEIEAVDKSLIEDIYIDDASAIVVQDGVLACIACLNDVTFEDGSVEIYVETKPEYRRRGFASEAVEILAEYCLKKGLSVRYKCAENNIGSISVAEKCGFVKTGERYSYVCYSID